MNTQISFKLAKLLKEKGYSGKCEYFYKKGKYDKEFYQTTGIEYDSDKNCIWDWNSKEIPYPNDNTAIYYSAPTIAEVVMWLYEKRGVWIEVSLPLYADFKFTIVVLHSTAGKLLEKVSDDDFDSPTEAYEAAVEYVLNKYDH